MAPSAVKDHVALHAWPAWHVYVAYTTYVQMNPVHKLFLIMTTGLLGFFLVKSQRDQLLFSLSTALDFNRPTLTHGGWALIDGYMDVVWVWVFICGDGLGGNV